MVGPPSGAAVCRDPVGTQLLLLALRNDSWFVAFFYLVDDWTQLSR